MPSDRFPLRNLAPQGPFLADLYEQYLAERSMQSDAVDVLAIYHCHPDGCTCMSDLDAQFAAREVELIRPDCSAVVFM